MTGLRLVAGSAIVAAAVGIPAARAGDLGAISNLAQGEFRKLS